MRTILIIEDDEDILSTYAFALEHAGYRPLAARDGAAGLEMARRHLPDLIICDLNMPGKDGWSTLRDLREDPVLAATQFVLMTGNTRNINARSGMELGADDFLVKPFGHDELLRCVEARFRRAGIHRRLTDKAISELRTNLHSYLPHEFFTPLAGILGLIEVLRAEGEDLSRSESVELLDEIERSGWRLHRTLRNYLFALDLDSHTPPDQPPIASPERAVEAIETGVADAARRNQRVDDIESHIEPCSLLCSISDLTLLVEELVDNACAYSRSATPVRVSLDREGMLSICDEGRGLTDAQISQIGAFRQFDRKQHEQQGLGIGLFLAQKLAARCGASLTIDSAVGAGTTVRVAFQIPNDDTQ